MTDEERWADLVARLRQGRGKLGRSPDDPPGDETPWDEAAWKEASERVREYTRVALRRYRVPDETVDDVAQQSLMKLLHSLDTVDPSRGAITAYVKTIVRNTAADAARRRPRPARPPAAATEHVPRVAEVDFPAELDWEAYLDGLSPKERELLGMRFGAGLSLGEISARLGQPYSTTGVHLFRAMHKVRKKLRERILGAADAALEAALESFPPDDGELLRMRLWEGHSLEAISTRLGQPYSAVAGRLFRLIQALRERVSGPPRP